MDNLKVEEIVSLEKQIRLLKQELLKHVAAPHYFSGSQIEKIEELEKKFRL